MSGEHLQAEYPEYITNLDFDISEEPTNDFTADFKTKGRA
jgi:hypothetical protein